MALIDHVYKDAALTEQFDDASDTLDAFALNGADGDGVFYIGEPAAGKVVEAASDPGIDPIVVSILDATPGSGVVAADIKLALSSALLDSAVAGDPLSIGASFVSEPAGAVPVHYRWSNSTGGAPDTDISLQITARITRDA